MDYPFHIACVQQPPPLRKNRRRGVCGEGDEQSISSSSLKTANNKIPVSSVFNDSEGLYKKTVCRCLVHRPHYLARLMRLGSRGPREFFPRYATEMPSPRLRGRTPNRDWAWPRCLPQHQRKTGNCCLSATSFTNSDISGCCFTSILRTRPPVQS